MRCLRCKCELEYSGIGRPRKYCEECAYVTHIEYMRGYMIRRRNLGTSDFYEHMYKNLNKEKTECEKEIKRIGFKRQFS